MTLKRSRLMWAEIQSQCLQVERVNTKSNAVYKKRIYNSTSLQGKPMMSDDFELGREGEMEPTSSVTFSTSLHKVWDTIYDTNPGMFSSNTFIYFRLKKEIHKHLGWHGGKEIIIWKWTNPLNNSEKYHNFYNNIKQLKDHVTLKTGVKASDNSALP